MSTKNFYAHESAFIDEGSTVGEGTKIWHFCHVMKGAEIGQHCILGQNVYVGSTAKIHNYVKIQNNVSVYDAVIIEDHVFCGPSMVFTNVSNPRSEIERKTEYQITRVSKGASIGANATIICGVTVGRYAFIGAGSIVTKDVPNFALIYGNPAKQKGWICRCGIKLSNQVEIPSKNISCSSCKQTYLYQDQKLSLKP